MREEVIVAHIKKWLEYKGRYYVNNHGGEYAKLGIPDFTTNDVDGRSLYIEAKAPKKVPTETQWNNCIRILRSGGRYIVAQQDFDLNAVDDGRVPTMAIDMIVGVSEFELAKSKINQTVEIIPKA